MTAPCPRCWIEGQRVKCLAYWCGVTEGPCGRCGGSGTVPGCVTCGGKGRFWSAHPPGPDCPACAGQGLPTIESAQRAGVVFGEMCEEHR